jgi:hypothetical protein
VGDTTVPYSSSLPFSFLLTWCKILVNLSLTSCSLYILLHSYSSSFLFFSFFFFFFFFFFISSFSSFLIFGFLRLVDIS